MLTALLVFGQLSVPCENPRIRKEFRQVQSEGNWDKVVKAYSIMKSTGRIDEYANLHQQAFKSIHGTPKFYTWHRAMMYEMETEMQSIVGPNFTIPYIDWANEGSLYNGQIEQSVAINPYFYGKQNGSCLSGQIYESFDLNTNYKGGPCLTRKANSSVLIGGWADLDNTIINSMNYSAINDAIQYGIHGDVHMHFGGPFSEHYSPTDPLFYGHHGFIDLTLNLWQYIHSSYKDMGVNITDTFQINNKTYSHKDLFQMKNTCVQYIRRKDGGAPNPTSTSDKNDTAHKSTETLEAIDSPPILLEVPNVNSTSATPSTNPNSTAQPTGVSQDSTSPPTFIASSPEDQEAYSKQLQKHYENLKSTLTSPDQGTQKIVNFYNSSFVPKAVQLSPSNIERLGLNPAKYRALADAREILRNNLAKLGNLPFLTSDEVAAGFKAGTENYNPEDASKDKSKLSEPSSSARIEGSFYILLFIIS